MRYCPILILIDYNFEIPNIIQLDFIISEKTAGQYQAGNTQHSYLNFHRHFILR